MSTYIYTTPSLPGLAIKVEAENEFEANIARNNKLDENIDWLRMEPTACWELNTSW